MAMAYGVAPAPPLMGAYWTRTEAANAGIPASISAFSTTGYAAAGDMGHGFYVAVAQPPAHPGFIQSREGRWWELCDPCPNPKQFGAKANGASDDSSAFSDLFAYCTARNCRNASLLGLYYSFGAGVTFPDPSSSFLFTLNGCGSNIIKRFNGDMFVVPQNVIVRDVKIRGQGAKFTGRCFVINAGNGQRFLECDVEDFDGYCLDCTAPATGQNSYVVGGKWWRTVRSNAAIKWPDEGLVSSQRHVINVRGESTTLVDIGGADNGVIDSCTFRNLQWGEAAKKIRVIGCRFANDAETMVIRGQSHTIIGNVSAGNITISAQYTTFVGNRMSGDLLLGQGAAGVIVAANSVSGTVSDISGNATNRIS